MGSCPVISPFARGSEIRLGEWKCGRVSESAVPDKFNARVMIASRVWSRFNCGGGCLGDFKCSLRSASVILTTVRT